MDFRQRLAQGKSIHDKEVACEPDETSVSEYFAISRLAGRTICLDVRLADGKRLALPYAYMNKISFNPDTGIEINTSQEHVTITGRNLSKLYDYLLQFSVRYVQANLGGDTQEDGLFIEEIRIEQNL